MRTELEHGDGLKVHSKDVGRSFYPTAYSCDFSLCVKSLDSALSTVLQVLDTFLGSK